MTAKPAHKNKYEGKPTRILVVEVIAEIFNGAATEDQVDAYLKETISGYKNNTYLNLRINTVNSNRGNWSPNKSARRTDDLTHRHHEYDRLFKRGDVYEIYDPLVHGVYEIYKADDGRWLTREVDHRTEFEREVESALKLTAEKRRQILSTESKTPKRIAITSYQFKRSPHVVAEVLALAGGKCQSCLRDAPFKREDGRPYLEVHHVEWLANGGEDSVENAIALCPNCHREAHYGRLKLKPVNNNT